ncbi:MAG: HIT domain-containing protein [Rhodothermales bacterium]|nr:HIT domain-containing protein [Rhodothermales bacterium]
MDRMWSPWRAQHVEQAAARAPGDGASVFTRMAREDRDEDHLILWRGQTVFVVMNRYPYNNGHLLIVPYREVADYEALTPAERAEIAETTARCLRWLRHTLRPDGFNVGMNLGTAGGAGIPEHLHVHVVPRWAADTNFMPALGQVKVIPEALRETYRRLRATAEALAEDPENL